MMKHKTRKRRTQSQVFLDKLKEISENGKKLISNITLRETLNWDEDKYIRVKESVNAEKKIIVGRGKGGLVGLAAAPGAKALELFVSYCHADEALKNEVIKHLTPLKHLELIEVWHDRKIPPGGDWDHIISTNLKSADIILILVSIDFINSKYCYDVELETALERHDQKSAVVIPVILRNCMWQHSPFAKIQAIPKDGRPVCSYKNQDDAFTEIANSIKLIAEKILEQK